MCYVLIRDVDELLQLLRMINCCFTDLLLALCTICFKTYVLTVKVLHKASYGNSANYKKTHSVTVVGDVLLNLG